MSRICCVFPLLVACGGAAVAPRPPSPTPPSSLDTSTTPSTSTSTSTLSSLDTSTSTAPPTPTSPPPATPLEAHATLGPFKNPAEACKALGVASKAKAIECLPGGNVGSPPPKSAIDRVMLLVLRDKARPDASVAHLALHTSAGWFVDPDGPESFTDAAMMKRFKTDVMPAGNSFFPQGALPGVSFGVRQDFAELTVVTTTDPSTGKKAPPQFHSVRASAVICALGSSGAPSCLDPIRTDPQLGKNGAPPPSPSDVAFDVKNGVWTVDASQKLSLLRNAGHFDTHEDLPLAGTYAPTFK